MQNIIYRYAGSLYLNLTNKCPCSCTFCIRTRGQGIGADGSLWLKSEPTATQLIAQLEHTPLEEFDEVVFCGYGEPFCALDTLLEVCAYLRTRPERPCIRINTNGLGDLINGKATASLLEGLVDKISISLNAPDSASYVQLCHPTFGEQSFGAVLSFARECKQYVPGVTLSVVDVISAEQTARCREIATELGIPLRVRHCE